MTLAADTAFSASTILAYADFFDRLGGHARCSTASIGAWQSGQLKASMSIFAVFELKYAHQLQRGQISTG